MQNREHLPLFLEEGGQEKLRQMLEDCGFKDDEDAQKILNYWQICSVECLQ